MQLGCLATSAGRRPCAGRPCLACTCVVVGVSGILWLLHVPQIITKDSNQACVVEAIGCVAALAKGLRKDYANSARNWTEVLMEKLKVGELCCVLQQPCSMEAEAWQLERGLGLPAAYIWMHATPRPVHGCCLDVLLGAHGLACRKSPLW